MRPEALRALCASALLACAGALASCGDDRVQALAPASISVAPTSADFGTVPLGARARRVLIVTNRGDDELVVETVKLEGADAASFGTGAASLKVPRAESRELVVTFQPARGGAFVATLVLGSNAANAPALSVPLLGRADTAVVCGDCRSPPPSACEPDGAMRVYAQIGSCDDGQCRYAEQVIPCAAGCDDATGTCNDVACEPDPAPLRFTNASGSSDWPGVAWSGDSYGVAWVDQRDGNEELYFARLSPAGEKLGDDLRLTETPRGSSYPSLAWAGDSYAIAFHEDVDTDPFSSDMYFARVARDGTPALAPVAVSAPGHNARYPSLAWNAVRDEMAIAYSDDFEGSQGIYFQRLTRDGALVGTPVRVSGNTGAYSAENPSLVWNGGEYGLVFADSRTGDTELFFQRMSPTGDKVGPEIRVTNAPNVSSLPQLAWTGNAWGIAWNDHRNGTPEIFFARLTPDGRRIGDDLRVTTAFSVHPHLAWGRDRFALTWSDNRPGGEGIYFVTIGLDGTPGTERRLSSTYASYFPVVAWGPGQFGTAWHSYTDGEIFTLSVCP